MSNEPASPHGPLLSDPFSDLEGWGPARLTRQLALSGANILGPRRLEASGSAGPSTPWIIHQTTLQRFAESVAVNLGRKSLLDFSETNSALDHPRLASPME